MKEIPFLQLHEPVALSSPPNTNTSSTRSIGLGGNRGSEGHNKRYVAVLSGASSSETASHASSSGGGGADGTALGISLVDASSTESSVSSSTSTALVPIDDANTNNHQFTTSTNDTSNNNDHDDEEETYHLRGLASTTYSSNDNVIICTNGIAGKKGLVRISVRDTGGDVMQGETSSANSANGTSNGGRNTDVEIDLSQLMKKKSSDGSNLFESPVGTSCFVIQHSNTDDGGRMETTILHLRSVDAYGSVLSLTLSYPQLKPSSSSSSFLLPLTPPKAYQHPHPGSCIEINQVCFPTPTSVVFALNPHLYCVDFGVDGGRFVSANGRVKGAVGDGAVTRVWTDIHHVVSDPIASSSREGGGDCISSSSGIKPTPRKRARQSLGNILTRAKYTLAGVAVDENEWNEEYEYNEDGDEIGYGSVAVPSIAALSSMESTDATEGVNVARVASIHSDGSFRIWVAEASRKKPDLHSLWEEEDDESEDMKVQKKEEHLKLRIPSVQRVAIQSSDSSHYLDPSIPHPSTWDSRPDSITLCGHVLDQSYEVALHVQCYADGLRKESCGSVYAIQGSIVDANNNRDDDPTSASGDSMVEMQLPRGSQTVVDLAWKKRDLLVLFRRVEDAVNGVAKEPPSFYGMEEYEDAKVALALYPLGSKQSLEPVLPSNMTLPYLDFNHFVYSFGLTVEEELDRFLNVSEKKTEGTEDDNDDVMEDVEAATYLESVESDVAKSEAEVDRAGLLSVLQPFGRPRPSAVAVSRALSTLNLVDRGRTMERVSPVDIVLAMRKWKKRDAFQSSSSSAAFETSLVVRQEEELVTTSPAGNSNSIYYAFASATKSVAGKAVHPAGIEAEQEFADNVEKSEADAVETARDRHLVRWIRLLSEIRQQESKLNEVLCLSSYGAGSHNLLTRGNMISVLSVDESPAIVPRGQGEQLMAGLDELSLELLTVTMANPEHRLVLCQLESMLYTSASKASALLSGWQNEGLDNSLVKEAGALGESAFSSFGMNDQQLPLLSEMARVGLDFADEWLGASTSQSAYVRVRLALGDSGATATSTAIHDDVSVLNVQSTAALVSARVESIRQLSLARLLLVLGSPMKNQTPIYKGALRASLYYTALSWAVKQSSSSTRSMTVLDEQLFIERKRTECGLESALTLANDFVASVFDYYAKGAYSNASLNLVSPSHEPQLALRLLAPLVEYPSQSSSSDLNVAAAECLLVEASVIARRSGADENGSTSKHLWELASQLLLDSVSMDALDGSRFLDIFEGLRNGRDQWWISTGEPQHEDVLFRALNMIVLIGDDAETQEDIKRLCTMQTTKALFLPSVLSSSNNGASMDHSFIDRMLSTISPNIPVPRLALYQFVKTLLKISSLMFRVETLERHLCLMESKNSVMATCCNVVLASIHDLISEMSSDLPSQMTRDMSELPTLWSIAFQTAMRGHLWDEALRACVSNSTKDRKKHNFRRLVLGMVNAGALGKLVDMSLTVVGEEDSADESISGGLDIFALACNVIEEDAYIQASLADSVDEAESKSEERPNYWGALYVLHASRGNWKQAAQAMGMWGKATRHQTKLSSDTSKSVVMDNASLSAHSCLHAMSLIDKSSDRYLLPGSPGSPSAFFQEDVASGLLTEEDIERQAVRAMALRAFSMDDLSPNSAGGILGATVRDGIDMLARLGYYDHAIAVAAGNSSKSKGQPGGVDLFDDSLKHILCAYLVPAAMHIAKNDGDCMTRSKTVQIRISSAACALGSAKITSQTPSVTSSSVNSKSYASNSDGVLQSDMAMDLLRQYTTVYSHSCRGLSLFVARAMFQSTEGRVELPQWLKELCMFGVTSEAETDSSSGGMFAHAKSKGNGNGIDSADPAGLVRLLMKYHKYEEACRVVISILSKQRTMLSKTSSRLPEKGSIDFVPYDLIDMLWNVIQKIVARPPSNSKDTKDQIESLLATRGRMEKALMEHFELLKISEEGLKSARVLAHG
eukprot:g12920.t1 g12920   contig7:458423-464320(-)